MKYVIFLTITMVSILGCSQSTDGGTNVGNAGDACYPNDTCNSGLICEDGICMEQDLTGTTGHPCYGNGTCNEGLICENEICVAQPYCGNNTIEGNEECDGNAVSDSCLDLGYYAGTTTCNVDCTLNVSACAGICGDGIIDTGEQCDGTNFGATQCDAGTLGCNADCTVVMDCAIFTVVYDDPTMDTWFALDTNGIVWAKGRADIGQLGNGLTYSEPTTEWSRVLIEDVIYIPNQGALDGYVYCAIKSDQTAWCWGRNTYGQLGDGTTNDSLVPVRFTMTMEPIDEIEFRFEGGWNKTCVHVQGAPVSEWVCTR